MEHKRSHESAVDRPWEPNKTECSSGSTGEVFALIRQALLDDVPVYANIGHNRTLISDTPAIRARVWDLQHKAGDWMRVGYEVEGQRYLEWRDFENIYHLWVGEREFRVRLPQTTATLTEIYD